MDGLVKRLREVASFSESRGYLGMAKSNVIEPLEIIYELPEGD